MDYINFKDYLINRYKKFDEFNKIIKNINDDYLIFLFLHLNDNIKINISKNKLENAIFVNQFNYDDEMIKSILLIYQDFLTLEEKQILESKTSFSVNCFIDEFSNDEVKLDLQIRRRDYLIPCFFHINTIKFLKRINHKDVSGYHKRLSKFYLILDTIRKNVKTKDRLGTIICSSFSMNTYNVRRSKDIDMVILHPYNDKGKTRKKLYKMVKKNKKILDPHIHGIYEWKNIDKTSMYYSNKILTKRNFYHLIFDPDCHYYFYGIKVINLEYDLKYRAHRRYPKNVSDLILIKNRLNFKIPKIKKLEDVIKIEQKDGVFIEYSKKKFISVVEQYLKKFGLRLEMNDIKKFIEDFSKMT